MIKILLSCIILYLLYLITRKINIEHFSSVNMSILEKDKRQFPYRYLQDEYGNVLPIVALTAFFRKNEDKELYYTYIKEGIKVIGMTAYKTFPKKIRDISEDKYHLTDDFDYLNNINVWLTCMNNLDRYNIDVNKHLVMDISESDFYNGEDPEKLSKINKSYDFIYICNKDADNCPMTGWNAVNRNYALALKCFDIMCNEYNLSGLCVGRIGCDLGKYKNITTTDFLPWHDLQQKMRESKFLFMPNIYDASPRVIAECLTKNLPVLMNQSIICGSKYVNKLTGELFIDEHDIKNALDNLIYKINNKLYLPLEWWNQTYSVDKRSVELRNFLYNIYPDILANVKKVKLII